MTTQTTMYEGLTLEPNGRDHQTVVYFDLRDVGTIDTDDDGYYIFDPFIDIEDEYEDFGAVSCDSMDELLGRINRMTDTLPDDF